MIQEIIKTVTEWVLSYGFNLLGALAIFFIGRWLARFAANMLRTMLGKANVDVTLASFLSNLSYYSLLAIVIIAALNLLGVNTASIVAVFGAATLAIGLALQDSLANFSAGIVIILLRPYRVGDYIAMNGVEGFVREIEIFHTLLVTRNKKSIYVPNKDAVSGNIVNYAKEEFIRLEVEFGIGYGDDLLKAKNVIMEVMLADKRIAEKPAPSVIVAELGESSVNLYARPYVNYKDDSDVMAALRENVKLRFDAEGISIPFPQRDVHVYQK